MGNAVTMGAMRFGGIAGWGSVFGGIPPPPNSGVLVKAAVKQALTIHLPNPPATSSCS